MSSLPPVWWRSDFQWGGRWRSSDHRRWARSRRRRRTRTSTGSLRSTCRGLPGILVTSFNFKLNSKPCSVRESNSWWGCRRGWEACRTSRAGCRTPPTSRWTRSLLSASPDGNYDDIGESDDHPCFPHNFSLPVLETVQRSFLEMCNCVQRRKKNIRIGTSVLSASEKSKHLKGQLWPRVCNVFAYSCPAPLPGHFPWFFKVVSWFFMFFIGFHGFSR